MLRLIKIFIISILHSSAVYPQVALFEERISDLLINTSGYENIEKIVFLIKWESEIIKNIPSISPVLPPDFRSITVSSAYGPRYHPITGEYKHHAGIDIPTNMGDSIYVSANGIVTKTAYDQNLGNYVQITHKYGFISTYGHLSEYIVWEGEQVQIGQLVGKAGVSGMATGPHLHYSIKKNNREEDPNPYCYLMIKYLLKSQSKEGTPFE